VFADVLKNGFIKGGNFVCYWSAGSNEIRSLDVEIVSRLGTDSGRLQ
jgi:hypothetical protein